MRCSASSTDAGRRDRRPASSNARAGRLRSALERGVARLLVAAIVSITPAPGQAGEEFESADHAVMLTPGEIDNSQAGQTLLSSDVQQGVTDWRAGFDQPVDNHLIFELSAESAQHLNLIGGNQIAILRGQISSGADDTIIFAAPGGIYIGSSAVIDVGSFAAVAADIASVDQIGARDLELSGRIVARPGSLIRANEDVLLYGTDVLLAGEIYTPGGRVLAVGADAVHFLDADTITEGLLNPTDLVALARTGGVQNLGKLTAESAALIGRRVVNTGHIEINDGTLMMLGGEAVRLVEFDSPVLVEIPRANGPDNHVEAPEFAVENRGTVDAGRGRVRLAAADPLGWGIRQVGEAGGTTPSIRAERIEIAGGESGRVEIEGVLEASNLEANGLGGSIEVTGGTIILAGDEIAEDGALVRAGARLDASGTAGGGAILVGGDELGRGGVQRARGVVIEEGAEVVADATTKGDGGRVIVFAESLTHIAGSISARGGAEGGNGGFVETSGLRYLSLETTPDLSAPSGDGGHWLIDPFQIQIVDESTANTDCPIEGDACLNKAIEAILDPSFDSAGFDSRIRSIESAASTLPDANVVSASLIARALSVGTSVTLSTEAFDPRGEDPQEEVAGGRGDIDVLAPILIPNAIAAPGTRATLALLAAGDINVTQDISVDATDDTVTPNMSLEISLEANDQAQRPPNDDFGPDQVNGDVMIDANIRTGGGSLVARGIQVNLTETHTIETDGGGVFLRSGSVDRFEQVREFEVEADTDFADFVALDTGVTVDGVIDTARPADDGLVGGAITLEAGSVNLRQRTSPNTLFIESGEVNVSGALRSGGGAVSLRGGERGTTNVGNVSVTAATIDSDGGAIGIEANRLDPDDDQLRSTEPLFNGSEGGVIDFEGANDVSTRGGLLLIGTSRTQRVELEGTFDTTGGDGDENGLLSVFAGDASILADDTDEFGSGTIELGGGTNTRLESAGIALESRDLQTVSSPTSSVEILARGRSLEGVSVGLLDATDVTGEDAETPFVTTGTIRLQADRQASFEANTRFRAETFDLQVAGTPTAITEAERTGMEMRFDPALRLSFAGSGGAAASDGVRIEADSVSIRTAAIASVTSDLTDPTMDPEIESVRSAGADYRGLQIRDAASAERPEAVTVVQSAPWTIAAEQPADPTATNRIFFGGRSGDAGTGGVFDGATIGEDGSDVVLTSLNGALTVEDALGLNSTAGHVIGEDDGASRVTLNGGFLLDSEVGNPAVDLTGIANPFEVASLTVTSPRSFTIDGDVVGAILRADTLSFQAGRATELEDLDADVEALGGTLTVQSDLTLAAGDALSLHAAAGGAGNLVFDDTGAPIRLQANSISIRAGGGRDTQASSTADRPEIQGAASVEYRGANGDDFETDLANTEKSFSFRQDAGIDAESHLPQIDAFFSGEPDENGFGLGDELVDYALRSDFGAVDLTTGDFGASDFRNVDISLIGREIGSADSVLVPDGFVFDGRHVTLGGTTGFTYGDTLAAAFAPSGVAAADDKELTLRAGSGGVGSVRFQSGVVVRAPNIRLVAGDGSGGDVGSLVSFSGVTFDMTDGSLTDRSFVFHEDQTFSGSDLPSRDQFVSSVLPTVFAIRNDTGLLDWKNPDFTELPLDLSAPNARLVLEAADVKLRATSTNSTLRLTEESGNLENLRLRIRTNDLDLEATGGDGDGGGLVIAGGRTADSAVALGQRADSGFDGESILVEGFTTGIDATTGNLSVISEVEGQEGQFNLEIGRGPAVIAVNADGGIQAGNLIRQLKVAGHLQAGVVDDAFGDPDETDVILFSTENDISVSADTVAGSDLLIGNEFLPAEVNVTFLSGDYFTNRFGTVTVVSEANVTLEGDTDIAGESIRIEAGFLDRQPFDEIDLENPMGQLVFEGTASSLLEARSITLRAGPAFRVTNRDFDGDGDPDSLSNEPGVKAAIDLSGVEYIDLDPSEGLGPASLSISSTADLDATELLRALDPASDPDASPTRFDFVGIRSIQSETRIDVAGTPTNGALGILAERSGALSLGSDEDEATLYIVAGPNTRPDPFSTAAGFGGSVELQSNGITIDARDAATELQLADPNLRILSRALRSNFDDPDELARVANDPDVLERTRFRLIQSNDFANTTLPRLDRYFRRGFAFAADDLTTEPREDFRFVEIALETTAGDLTFTNALRNGTIGSNLLLENTGAANGVLTLAVDDFRPGVADYAFESLTDLDNANNPALDLASFEATGFEDITVPEFAPTRVTDNAAGTAESTVIDFTVDTTGDQDWGGNVLLAGTLDAIGRDLTIAGDVFRNTLMGAPLDAGLAIQTRGKVVFGDDLGVDGDGTDGDTPDERLGFLDVLFEDDSDGQVQFQRPDGDDEPQFVFTDQDIVFATLALDDPSNPRIDGDTDPSGDFRTAIAMADGFDFDASDGLDPNALNIVLETFEVGRDPLSPIATVGKSKGNLSFRSTGGGQFIMGSGERLAVAGDLLIDAAGQAVSLGDVASGGANGLRVIADEIGLVRRNAGVTFLPNGASTQDRGGVILANAIDFGGLTPIDFGPGKRPGFALPSLFAPGVPDFLDGFSAAAISADGTGLEESDFVFTVTGDLAGEVAIPIPSGPSRSELTGAVPPLERAGIQTIWRDLQPLQDVARMAELGIDARDTPPKVLVARLEGGAIIDDLGLVATTANVPVTESRLNPTDAEAAIALYESLFGPDGEQAPEVQAVLQDALDRYRAETRARRIVGFELRRFVKNRPSTLLEAYGTLDRLDALFRYHRRLGLSRGEFRVIQREWLKEIKPEGITLDELSEAIHPSRYVRGSDILDLFGR